MSARSIPVTVTAADLDVAMRTKLTKGDEFDRCAECLIAVAMTRSLGRPCGVGYMLGWDYLDVAGTSGTDYDLPDAARELIDLFDDERFEHLRQMLPITFSIEARR